MSGDSCLIRHPVEPVAARSAPPTVNQSPSIISSISFPIEEWGKLIGDVPSATAILDRFLHHAEIINITGRNRRSGKIVKYKRLLQNLSSIIVARASCPCFMGGTPMLRGVLQEPHKTI